MAGSKSAPGPRASAGIAVYRTSPPAVLLVRETHGLGRGTWGIPKGARETDEADREAARREVREETGLDVRGTLVDLGYVHHAAPLGRTHAFAAPAPVGANPRPSLPEVDRAEFVDLSVARDLVHPDQRPILDQLRALLSLHSPGRPAPLRRPVRRARLRAEVAAYLADRRGR